MKRTILLNGEPLELGTEPTSIGELVRGLYSSGVLQGDVIKSINYGDKNLLLAEQGVDLPLPNGVLELQTVPAFAIIIEVMGDARALLSEIETELSGSVEAIRVYGGGGVIEPLKKSADLLLVLMELLSSLDEFLDRWSMSEVNIGFSSFKTRLADALGGLVRFQELQDWSCLADLLEYELIPLLQELAEHLRESIEKLNHIYNQ